VTASDALQSGGASIDTVSNGGTNSDAPVPRAEHPRGGAILWLEPRNDLQVDRRRQTGDPKNRVEEARSSGSY